MRSVVRTACILAMLGITPVYAADYINSYVPEARLVGKGRAQVLFWEVYDAKLYAPKGLYADGKPFALELSYLLELEGRKIADHAVSEMRRLGYKNEVKLATWHDRMSNIFPDVLPGRTLTGIYLPEGPTIFYDGESEAGRIDDPEFGQQFFRIWLDASSSTPMLRKKLLNGNHATTEGYDNEISEQTRIVGGGHAS